MIAGDIVRLKQPFRPTANAFRTYDYGIVAGIVREASDTEVLVRLYDLETATIYTDEFKAEAIFSFCPDEIDCCISI